MTNEVRGQIPAVFDGGRINLVLSTGAMCSLEAEEKRRAWAEVREFGKPPDLVKPRKLAKIIEDLGGEPTEISMSDVCMVFWAMMLEERPDATLADAQRLIDGLRGNHDQIMSDAILAAFPDPKEGAEPGK
ncbi:hypothetical protein [Pseudophaeobacter sp.]|jgi:hypothetical protein|uniref:hypothetical protein n=1 Tax=Pseudophaeobacter sp. TaxID=1971739 RepID=UPI0032D92147